MATVQPRKPWFRRWWAITLWVIIGLVVIASIIGGITGQGSVSGPAYSPEETARLAHCDVPGVVKAAIKSNLKDPGSFEWSETSLGTPTADSLAWGTADENGLSTFTAIVRARNSFGGLVPSTWHGEISSATCQVTSLRTS